MGKKTTTPGRRAVLLNKGTKSKKLDEKKVEAFMKEFLKTTNKQKIISPPTTEFEKALIIQEPTFIRLKTPKKIILPTFVENTPPKKTTTRRKK